MPLKLNPVFQGERKRRKEKMREKDGGETNKSPH